MAYSDYGGYAFRNGVRVAERSDAVLSPEGIKSTPGQWPGWTLPEGRAGGSYHVLLGDGPIFVGLYKQSSLSVHRLGERIDLLSIAQDLPAEAIWTPEGGGKRYLDESYFKDRQLPCVLEIDGHRIMVRWIEEENHYQFVRLEQPDGNVWHGWSGYGVGAGLVEAGYGFSTQAQNQRLVEFWPDAIV